MNGAYLMFVPDYLVIKMMDFVRKYDDVLIFRADKFQDVYKDIIDECSVADVSVEANVKIGQG